MREKAENVQRKTLKELQKAAELLIRTLEDGGGHGAASILSPCRLYRHQLEPASPSPQTLPEHTLIFTELND